MGWDKKSRRLYSSRLDLSYLVMVEGDTLVIYTSKDNVCDLLKVIEGYGSAWKKSTNLHHLI